MLIGLHVKGVGQYKMSIFTESQEYVTENKTNTHEYSCTMQHTIHYKSQYIYSKISPLLLN